MSPVAVSADRRFHRAHVKPGRRKTVWRMVAVAVVKYGVLLALLVFVGAQAMTFARESAFLRVAQIRTTGNQRVSTDEIRSLLAGLGGESILLTDLEGWRARVLASPWVREVTLRRSLPSTIEVAIQEKQPIAIGRINGQLYLVDESGTVIDQYQPDYASLDLPIVDGFTNDGAESGANQARAALAARVIMALRQKPDVAGRLSQVDVSDVHNASVLLTDDPAELRVGEGDFLARVESYLSLAPSLREQVLAIDYVDLRFDGRVYVRPAGKPARTAAPGRDRTAVSRVSVAEQQ